VVLTIVSVLVSSISYVLLRERDSLQADSASIAQNLQLLRQRAIRDDRPYRVEIDLADNSLRFVDQTIELSADVSITVKTAQQQLIDAETVGMTFYPDASSSGGLITLENDREIVEISVVWISGKIVMRQQAKTG
jgi:type II secretory pathway pseudopilin PulG